MQAKPRFDVCVLGAGPGGYAAAMRAHDLGKRVALVEKGRIGGAGVHAGALSSKTLWHLSNDYCRAQRTDRGYRAQGFEVSFPEVVKCVHEAVRERETILSAQLDKMVESGISLFRGMARFATPHSVDVKSADGKTETVEADNFVIATGSTPRVPDGIPMDGKRILTSDHIEELEDFPKSLVIVGAGVVGCEYATVFGNFGKTKIYIIDRQPRILPFEDEDVSDLISKSFEGCGITIHRGSKLCSMVNAGTHVEYEVEDAAGKKERIQVERALISTGRAPNTGSLNLEGIGVALEKSGAIVVEDTRSTVPHIYAAGDVTMDVALVNIAELEGRHAVERMFGVQAKPVRYEALSAIMFLKPEVASVGLNELSAKAKGIPYRVGVVHNKLVVRNLAMRATEGFVKLVVAKDPPYRLLGLRVVGPQAASTIQGVAFLIDRGATLEDIEHCVHPHPAIPEGVQECARLLLGRSIHKVQVFGPELLWVGEG